MGNKTKTLLAVIVIVVACVGFGAVIYHIVWGGQSGMPAAMASLQEVPTAGNAAVGLPPQTSLQAGTYTGPKPPKPTDPAVAGLSSPDEATRKKFIAQLHALGDGDPHTLGDGDPHALGVDLGKWGDALIPAGYADDANELAKTVIINRAMEPTADAAAQRLRVLALIAHANAQTPSNPADWKHALAEAKGYYNSATLANSAEGANLLAEVLAVTADPVTATAFLKQQAVLDADAPASQASDILKSIQVDKTQWDVPLQALRARMIGGRPSSYTGLMCQGEYYLLDDQGYEARKCFEGAVGLATTKIKMVREALEGVARSIRAQDGNVVHANAFILSLRQDPETDGASLIDGGGSPPALADLQTAAKAIKLADMRLLDTAPAPTK